MKASALVKHKETKTELESQASSSLASSRTSSSFGSFVPSSCLLSTGKTVRGGTLLCLSILDAVLKLAVPKLPCHRSCSLMCIALSRHYAALTLSQYHAALALSCALLCPAQHHAALSCALLCLSITSLICYALPCLSMLSHHHAALQCSAFFRLLDHDNNFISCRSIAHC